MRVLIIATLSLFAVACGPCWEDYAGKETEPCGSMPMGGSFICLKEEGGVSSEAGNDVIPIAL